MTSLSYSYKQKNRLVRVSSQSAILLTYDHDFLDRQMAKDLCGKASPGSFGALTAHFHYDRAGHLIGEENEADLSVTEYIWLDNMPVGQCETAHPTPCTPIISARRRRRPTRRRISCGTRHCGASILAGPLLPIEGREFLMVDLRE